MDQKRRSRERTDEGIDDIARVDPQHPSTQENTTQVALNAGYPYEGVAEKIVAKHLEKAEPPPARTTVVVPSDPSEMRELLEDLAKEAIIITRSEQSDQQRSLSFFGGQPIVRPG